MGTFYSKIIFFAWVFLSITLTRGILIRENGNPTRRMGAFWKKRVGVATRFPRGHAWPQLYIWVIFWVGFWVGFSKKFLGGLDLKSNPITTQIEPNDALAELLQAFVRANNVLIDMNVDMWLYIERNIFIQKNKFGEVGSSTMPHKINPIFFENAEGNLEIANTSFGFLSSSSNISFLTFSIPS